MQVSCPHCATRYILPESLLGPLGARVRCPRCRETFTVEPPVPVQMPTAAEPSAAETKTGPASPEWSRRVEVEAAEAAVGTERAERPGTGDPAPRSNGARAESPGEARTLTPEQAARTVIAELAARAGEALIRARAEGRLFAEFGQAIGEAFDSYRQKVGPAADPAAFRAALRERWGVDLEPASRPRPS